MFAKQFLNESKEATELLRQSIDVRSSRGETAENEKMALAQSLYRQISSPGVLLLQAGLVSQHE